MKRYLWSDIDEDELLGLGMCFSLSDLLLRILLLHRVHYLFTAHCLHNIGLLFDMKKEHDRSLPHYEEALTIKNALAGLDTGGTDYALTNENDNFILRCLDDNSELPVISKATLSTAMTHIRMASVYAKVCFHYPILQLQLIVILALLTFASPFYCITEKGIQLLPSSLLPGTENPTKGLGQRPLHYICTVK
jgi:hypothetical protein